MAFEISDNMYADAGWWCHLSDHSPIPQDLRKKIQDWINHNYIDAAIGSRYIYCDRRADAAMIVVLF